MRYALLVLTPPDAGASARHALMFARELVRRGHSVHSVFFFEAGVLTAATNCESPQDEEDLRAGWEDFHAKHDVPLVACVSSAHRFGVTDIISGNVNTKKTFRIAGLGELVEASTSSDRLITFRG